MCEVFGPKHLLAESWIDFDRRHEVLEELDQCRAKQGETPGVREEYDEKNPSQCGAHWEGGGGKAPQNGSERRAGQLHDCLRVKGSLKVCECSQRRKRCETEEDNEMLANTANINVSIRMAGVSWRGEREWAGCKYNPEVNQWRCDAARITTTSPLDQNWCSLSEWRGNSTRRSKHGL